jgi:hypothetical protein
VLQAEAIYTLHMIVKSGGGEKDSQVKKLIENSTVQAIVLHNICRASNQSYAFVSWLCMSFLQSGFTSVAS